MDAEPPATDEAAIDAPLAYDDVDELLMSPRADSTDGHGASVSGASDSTNRRESVMSFGVSQVSNDDDDDERKSLALGDGKEFTNTQDGLGMLENDDGENIESKEAE